MSSEFHFDHPKAPTIIRSADDTLTFAFPEGLAVFSDEERAYNYAQIKGLSGFILKTFPTWNELVDIYGGKFDACLVDHQGKEGFYSIVPLSVGP